MALPATLATLVSRITSFSRVMRVPCVPHVTRDPRSLRSPWLSRVMPAALAVSIVWTAAAATTTASAAGFVSVARDEINMRTGPGTKFESRWMLSRGFPLQTIARQGDWLKVRDFEKDEGWVFRPLTGNTPHVVVTSTTANIRNGPATNQRRIGRAEYGEVLRTHAKRAGWVQVSQEGGVKGWVSQRLVWGW